ncbi:MAG: YtxH domain-containing protein [Candidatus Eisenbacteria bacterium]|uniref:YtxH domain-containing protein n=1 Tax=Eiseniibacteriota bacterium TaxID=2212470 RepID=A0A849SUS6_UNCEI|nr:YtxH domain-containing protein [Candidatus Eisenbacteria bacterium]
MALMLAPMAGEETRRHLGEAARKLKDGAKDRVDDIKHMVKDRAEEVGGAIDAGKDAFRGAVREHV